jgi:hypothetical protein
MKKYLLIIVLFFSIKSLSQTIKYNTKIENGFYDEYISKDNFSIKIGDTILIKFPRIGNNYNFITQGNTASGMILVNQKVIIHKIKSYNNNVFLLFKGYGLLPVFIQYENAIESKEIELTNQ